MPKENQFPNKISLTFSDLAVYLESSEEETAEIAELAISTLENLIKLRYGVELTKQEQVEEKEKVPEAPVTEEPPSIVEKVKSELKEEPKEEPKEEQLETQPLKSKEKKSLSERAQALLKAKK